MVDRLEGTRLPPYAEATKRSMRELGPGGKGNHEALSDAAARNVGVALGVSSIDSTFRKLQPANPDDEAPRNEDAEHSTEAMPAKVPGPKV